MHNRHFLILRHITGCGKLQLFFLRQIRKNYGDHRIITGFLDLPLIKLN